MKITRETTILDVLKMDPNTADIFFAFGMHCIGCPHSAGESIYQAANTHGVDANALIDALIAYFE